MGGEGEGATTPARRIIQNEVVRVLGERVKVETVEELRSDSIVLITIRLPVGLTERVRLATQEWVQLQLIALERAQAPDEHVYVALYV
jgi:hypothetical protein